MFLGRILMLYIDVFEGSLCAFSSAEFFTPPWSEPNTGVPVPLVFPVRDPESEAPASLP